MSDSKEYYYRFFKNSRNLFLNKFISEVDFFVLLTEQMSKRLNIQNDRYVVVESIYNNLKLINLMIKIMTNFYNVFWDFSQKIWNNESSNVFSMIKTKIVNYGYVEMEMEE